MPILSAKTESMLLVIPAVFSIVGTLMIMLTYYKFVKLRQYRHVELAFYVAVNDFLGAIELCGGSAGAFPIACWLQGIGTSYNFLSSVFWNSVITYQIYKIINQGSVIEDLTKFHWLCWGFPLLMAVLPIATNNYGPDPGSWCFLVDRPGSPAMGVEFWEIFSFFFWLWLGLGFNFFVFFLILIRLREIDTEESMTAYKPLYRLGFCPLILLICWSLPSFLVVFKLTTGRSYDGIGTETIHSLSSFLPPFQGFLMFVAFFSINESASLEWKAYFSNKPSQLPDSNPLIRDTISTLHVTNDNEIGIERRSEQSDESYWIAMSLESTTSKVSVASSSRTSASRLSGTTPTASSSPSTGVGVRLPSGKVSSGPRLASLDRL